MTSVDADVWERFREAGAVDREKSGPMTSINGTWNSAAWDAEREKSQECDAAAWAKGSGTAYKNLLEVVDVARGDLTKTFGEQCTDAYIGRALARFGAKRGPTNETYATEEKSLPELSASLRGVGVLPVEGVIYQYCSLCAVVEAFYAPTAEACAAIIGRTGITPVYLVAGFNNQEVCMNDQFVPLTEASIFMYAHHFYHGHADICWGGGMKEQHLRSAPYKYVDSLQGDRVFHSPVSPPRVKLSRLVRTPRLPTKNIDIDVLCVDPVTGAPVALIEESSSPAKAVYMTVNVARVLRAPYVVAVKTSKGASNSKIFEGAAVHYVDSVRCETLPARTYGELSVAVKEMARTCRSVSDLPAR